MQISGMPNNYSVINSPVRSQLKQPIEADNIFATKKDAVTLSPQGMKELEKLAMYTEQTGKYLPEVTILNNPDSHKIGYAARAQDFQHRYKNELSEYTDKFKTYYAETKNKHGIVTADDHYEKVIRLKGGNIEFQQTFEDKLKSDPRMLKLMELLGINRPT